MNNWTLLIDRRHGRRVSYMRFKTPRARRIVIDFHKLPLRWLDRLDNEGGHLKERGKSDYQSRDYHTLFSGKKQ